MQALEGRRSQGYWEKIKLHTEMLHVVFNLFQNTEGPEVTSFANHTKSCQIYTPCPYGDLGEMINCSSYSQGLWWLKPLLNPSCTIFHILSEQDDILMIDPIKFFIPQYGTREMVHWVKSFAAKPVNTSSIPILTRWKGRTDYCKLSSNLHT